MLQIIVVTGGQVVLDRMSIPKLPLYGQESLANRNNLAGQFKYSEWPPVGVAKSPSGAAESGVVESELASLESFLSPGWVVVVV